MSDLMKIIILPTAFMLIPVWIPIIGVTVGAVIDLVRRDTGESTRAVVQDAKRRTVAAHQVTSEALAA